MAGYKVFRLVMLNPPPGCKSPPTSVLCRVLVARLHRHARLVLHLQLLPTERLGENLDRCADPLTMTVHTEPLTQTASMTSSSIAAWPAAKPMSGILVHSRSTTCIRPNGETTHAAVELAALSEAYATLPKAVREARDQAAANLAAAANAENLDVNPLLAAFDKCRRRRLDAECGAINTYTSRLDHLSPWSRSRTAHRGHAHRNVSASSTTPPPIPRRPSPPACP